jgi:hypothetical protein
MRMVACAAIAVMAAAACGGCDGSSDGDGGDDDSCGSDVCSPGACGVLYRDGCEPVDCGLCRYDGAVIDPEGMSSSMFAGDPPVVVYVARNGVDHEMRLARLDGSAWTSEVVGLIAAGGASGPTTEVWRTAAGTTWVAWSDSEPMVFTAHRAAGAATWTFEPAVGPGVRPKFAELADGTVVLTYVSLGVPTAMHVHRRAGAGWGTPTVIADRAFALAIAAAGADVHVAWRNQDQDVRYALSSDGGAFAIEDVRTGIGGIATAATIAIDLDGSGVPHLAYSVGELATVHARRTGATWENTELGRGFGQDRGAALVAGESIHVAYLNAFALQIADRSGTRFTDQSVANRCDDGWVALGENGGGLHLVYSCYPSEGVFWLRRRAERFPDGWNARCQAVADVLYQTACSCAPDPQRPECCITVQTESGTSRQCSSGQTPRSIAYAVVCGDATVDPTILDGCEPAAAGAACIANPEEGVVVVPDACLPP